jgi:riboflavin kinase/FMN adenylyltransferase
MWITYDIKHVKLDGASGVTLGAFDGVHRGHQALIRTMVRAARERALAPVVITFDPLPWQVVGAAQLGTLSDLDERLAHIEGLAVDGVVVLPFDTALLNTPAEAFVRAMVDDLNLRALWIGPDFKLGKDRRGDVAFLTRAGDRLGFEVQVLEQVVTWQGQPVRSSRIRRALAGGDIAEANGCLGYAYHLTGVVVHGEKRGRQLGFPTANLAVSETRLLPANGVYICRAYLPDGSYDAITNVGTRPTFNHHPASVEAYLLDFSGDLYGAPMRLEFLAYLRPERRFPSAQALITQMQRDEAEARAWLHNAEPVACPWCVC